MITKLDFDKYTEKDNKISLLEFKNACEQMIIDAIELERIFSNNVKKGYYYRGVVMALHVVTELLENVEVDNG